MVDRRHRCRDREAGQHAREHQAHQVDLRIRERVDDHRDRRRDDRSQDRHRGGQRRRVLGLIAIVLHHPDHDRAGAGGIGERGPADAREEGDRQDVGVPEPAAKATDELRGEPEQDVRERAARHQFRGQDEERHGHQREHVDAAEQVFRQRDRRQAADADRRERRAAERERHRHAECKEHDAGDEQRCDHRSAASASKASSARKRLCRTYGAAISSRWTIISANPMGIAR